jgi:hypothetical protein
VCGVVALIYFELFFGRGLETLYFDQQADIMLELLEVFDATLEPPAAGVLDDVAFAIGEFVLLAELYRLDSVVLVVSATYLIF